MNTATAIVIVAVLFVALGAFYLITRQQQQARRPTIGTGIGSIGSGIGQIVDSVYAGAN